MPIKVRNFCGTGGWQCPHNGAPRAHQVAAPVFARKAGDGTPCARAMANFWATRGPPAPRRSRGCRFFRDFRAFFGAPGLPRRRPSRCGPRAGFFLGPFFPISFSGRPPAGCPAPCPPNFVRVIFISIFICLCFSLCSAVWAHYLLGFLKTESY